jgi:hypothetical protein
MESDPYDWADDDSLSAEETMRIFESLSPKPTTGPSGRTEQIPTPDELMPRAQTFASSVTTTKVFPHLKISRGAIRSSAPSTV